MGAELRNFEYGGLLLEVDVVLISQSIQSKEK